MTSSAANDALRYASPDCSDAKFETFEWEAGLIIDWAIAGGFLSGFLAGGAARFGRLCTMGAIEDALIGRDYRGTKAWGLALAIAVISTQVATMAGIVNLTGNIYNGPQVHLLAILTGGLLFGLGMTLVGTCSFGLFVRAGSGDLRALIVAATVGVFAFVMIAGVLAPVRAALIDVGVIHTFGSPSSIDALLGQIVGSGPARILMLWLPVLFITVTLGDRRMWQRPRLMLGAAVLGLSITLGWWTTTKAVDALALEHSNSLGFVVPVGRGLLQLMGVPMVDTSFGAAAVLGVIAASFCIAAWRGEFRWEAFDDPREMRRHLFGAMLMGAGGALSKGCTIGQGMSAASTLAVSAPIFIGALLVGAWLGLHHLIDGNVILRVGFLSRSK